MQKTKIVRHGIPLEKFLKHGALAAEMLLTTQLQWQVTLMVTLLVTSIRIYLLGIIMLQLK